MECGYATQTEESLRPVEYGKSYNERHAAGKPEIEMSWLRLGFISKFVQSGSLLDVGFGSGEFIRQANRVGFDAFGYDKTRPAEDFPEGVREGGIRPAYDVVTLFDSLEHLPLLNLVFLFCPKWFFVTVPILPDSWAEEFLQNWRHYKPNEHLHYFTKKAVEALFARNYFKLVECANVEDVLRKNPDSSPNTMTFAFKVAV